jgi:CBS domain-containing protein
MTVGVRTCAPQTPLTEVARLLLETDLEGIVVLDSEGHSVGAVTRNELIAGYVHPQAGSLTAADVMLEGVPEIPPDIPITAAAQIMRDLGTRVVFLLHHAQGISWPAATLSYTHILRHLAAQNDDELKDLGVKAERESPVDTFIRKRDTARRQVKHGE